MKTQENDGVCRRNGRIRAVNRFHPIDHTTNPALVFAALRAPESVRLIAREIEAARVVGLSPSQLVNLLSVALCAELAGLVPGRVSTVVHACLCFDTRAVVCQAKWIVADYAELGISKDRLLITLAATWEGIRAAEILQGQGIEKI